MFNQFVAGEKEAAGSEDNFQSGKEMQTKVECVKHTGRSGPEEDQR
jgi:hypothetical protein